MATLIKLKFAGADLAASTGGATMPVAPLPDAVDVTGVQFPVAVEILGIIGATTITSTDTVTLTPLVGGAVPTGAPTAVLSGAGAAQASVLFGNGQGVKVAPFTTIGLQYKTTTASTYTVHDIIGALLVKLPDSI